MLWPLFKLRRRGGLWAVQALVPGDSLGDLSLVAFFLGWRWLRRLAPGDRTIPGYLRTPYETMQARLGGLRLDLGLSLLGVVATTAGSLHRGALHLLFLGDTRKRDLPGHVTDSVKLRHQPQPP